MIEELIAAEHIILDLGAGGGNWKFDFTKQAKLVVGLDRCQEVRANPYLVPCQADASYMPFRRESFDLVFSNYVLEHVADPDKVAGEVYRVLKPGGAFVLRTANLYHYVSLFSKITPFHAHQWLRCLMMGRDAGIAFPTFYRCNTRRSLLEHFTRAGFSIDVLQMVEKEPSYLLRWPALFFCGLVYERLVNRYRFLAGLRCNIFAVFRKPTVEAFVTELVRPRERPR